MRSVEAVTAKERPIRIYSFTKNIQLLKMITKETTGTHPTLEDKNISSCPRDLQQRQL